MKETHYRVEVRGDIAGLINPCDELYPKEPNYVCGGRIVWVSVLLIEYDNGTWEVK